MIKVKAEKIISADPVRVWEILSAWDKAEAWLPEVQSTRVEGQGVGAIRVLTLRNGTASREELTRLDELERELCYMIHESSLPIAEPEATFRVRAAEGGGAHVECEIHYRAVSDDPPEHAASYLRKAFFAALLGLEKQCDNGVAAEVV